MRPSAADMALGRIMVSEHITLPDGTLPLIIANAEGGMRDALSLLDTIAALGNTATAAEVRAMLGLTAIGAVEELIDAILAHNAAVIPPFFAEQGSGGVDFIVFNKNVLEYLRLMLEVKVTNVLPTTVLLDDMQFVNLQSRANLATTPQLLFIIRLLLRAYKEFAQSPFPELPIMLAAIEASLHGSPQGAASSAPVSKQAISPVINTISNKPFIAEVTRIQETQVMSAPIAAVQMTKPEPALETSVEITLAEGELDVNATKEQVMQWWPEVVQRIKTVNSPLSTLIKNSPLVEVSGGKITIAVKYLFIRNIWKIQNTPH